MKRLPKGSIVTAMGHLNVDDGSGNILLVYVIGKHSLGECNHNSEKFVDFCSFQHFVIDTTEQRAWQRSVGFQLTGSERAIRSTTSR